MGKQCGKCKSFKPSHEFWECKGTPDNLQYNCIECMQKHWIEVLDKRKQKPVKPNSIIKAMLRSARKRAKRDGILFTIRDCDIAFVDTCPIRGVKLIRNQGKISPDNYSLDRRDNSKGYEPGNVFIISWMANQSKSNMTVEQVEKLLRYMKGTL